MRATVNGVEVQRTASIIALGFALDAVRGALSETRSFNSSVVHGSCDWGRRRSDEGIQ